MKWSLPPSSSRNTATASSTTLPESTSSALLQQVVVSGNSICMDLQGIADGACTAGDPVMVIMSVSS